MVELNKIGTIFLLIVGAVLILVGAGAYLSPGGSITDSVLGEQGERAVCSGTVNVVVPGRDTFEGTPVCSYDSCRQRLSLFGDIFLFGLAEQDGEVRAVADDQVVGSETWEAILGNNQDFTIKTSCYPAGADLKLILYEGGDYQTEVSV